MAVGQGAALSVGMRPPLQCSWLSAALSAAPGAGPACAWRARLQTCTGLPAPGLPAQGLWRRDLPAGEVVSLGEGSHGQPHARAGSVLTPLWCCAVPRGRLPGPRLPCQTPGPAEPRPMLCACSSMEQPHRCLPRHQQRDLHKVPRAVSSGQRLEQAPLSRAEQVAAGSCLHLPALPMQRMP